MNEDEIHLARSMFRARIDSLRNDVMRCFWPITNAAHLEVAPSPTVMHRVPQYAPFPAIMYCFATLDYFSSLWEGWNDSQGQLRPADRTQNKRMTDFACKFLHYPRREAFIAVTVWRHKLMHTSEPRLIKSRGGMPPTDYYWAAGVGGSYHVDGVEARHMRLEKLKPDEITRDNRSLLYFDCYEFVRDLESGVFGATGYFTALLDNKNHELPPQPPAASAAGVAPSAVPAAGAAGGVASPPTPPRRLQQNYLDCLGEMENYPIDFSKVGLLPE